jgi:uncharacterized protein YggE
MAIGARWLGVTHSQPRVITVTGESRLTGEPDLARLMFGVQKSGKTVAEAEKLMSDVISRVIAAVEKAGVTKQDVATSELQIRQGWDYRKNRPSGYEVSAMLTITVRNVQHVGRVVDSAVANGLNRLEGVSYDVRSAEWRRKALHEALGKAREKAEAMAAGTGQRLGPVVSVREAMVSQASPADEYYDRSYGGFMDAYAKSSGEAEMPRTRSLPGQRAMMVEVEVVYEL